MYPVHILFKLKAHKQIDIANKLSHCSYYLFLNLN